MNEQALSLRLKQVSRYIQPNARLADIGSDHAYLPVALMLKGSIEYAVAGEVVKGPYLSACQQVEKNQLTDKIVVRLADGLAAIQPTDDINTITICGMGGSLIRQILTEGSHHLNGKERLILQPNVGEATLRDWLNQNDYAILAEEILEENQKIYEIIVAEKQKSTTKLNEKGLFFGPFLMQEKNAVFIKKWQREYQQIKKVLKQLQQAQNQPLEKIATLTTQLDWIKELLGDEII